MVDEITHFFPKRGRWLARAEGDRAYPVLKRESRHTFSKIVGDVGEDLGLAR